MERLMATVTPIEIIVYSLSANGVLDDGSPMYAYVKVPSVITSVTECIVSLAFRQFMAPATAAASGGGSTSGSSSSSTSDNESSHQHVWGTGGAGTGFTTKVYTDGGGTDFQLPTNSSSQLTTDGGAAHGHGMAHTHSTPNHTHALTYGTYEETYPASHSVKVKTYERVGSSWTLRNTSSAITTDLADLNLTSIITGPGDWQLRIQSDAGQPNAGRLGCDLYGAITARIG
jgi:hypothetical protein